MTRFKYILVLAFIIGITYTVFPQTDTYYKFPENAQTTIQPDFLNVDSILKQQGFSFFDQMPDLNEKSANFELDVLGERYEKSFIKDLEYTYLREIKIVLNQEDTVTLNLRGYVFKDSAEASKIYKHLDKKIASGIIVPDYRIIYREENIIYFISMKTYFRKLRKSFRKIIFPIYNSAVAKGDRDYLLFKQDLRIRRNRPI
jgi:hypothetical protein